MIENIFKLKKHGTNIKTEVIAGITTFLAMAYILGVNPSILSESGMDKHSVFLATSLSAAIGCFLMGIIANYPVALAPGMGVNALFTYTVCIEMGYSFHAALAAVFVSGIVFLLISVTGIRKKVINAIPSQMKLAIGAGIGFFIAFVGLKNAGVIVSNVDTGVALGNFKDPLVLLAIFGILVTIALVIKKVPAAVFIGMVLTAIVGVICHLLFDINGMPTLPHKLIELDFHMNTVGAFASGFQELFANPMQALLVLFSFLFVDFFDTAGTLVAVANRVNLVNESGEIENVERALVADAVGTVAGAMLGTSTVTSFVESSSGVEVGGRTGLTACTTGVLFLISIIFSPIILSTVTSAVTTPALVVVGVLMAQQLKDIKWDDFTFAPAAFITIITMVLTYSIANGIALGFFVYAISLVAAGKIKEVHGIIWCLLAIFIIYFAI